MFSQPRPFSALSLPECECLARGSPGLRSECLHFYELEIAHLSVRSVYISLLGRAPVPGQFWTVHDSITEQLGNVS